MKNEPKTDVLLRMMEQSERYTEEQWRDILSNSECRELYTLMAMTRGSVAAAKAEAALTDEEIKEDWERVKGMTNDESRFARNVESTLLSSFESNSHSSFLKDQASQRGELFTHLSSYKNTLSHFKLQISLFVAALFIAGLFILVPRLKDSRSLAIYEGSYVIENGQRSDDLRDIKADINEALSMADQAELLSRE